MNSVDHLLDLHLTSTDKAICIIIENVALIVS